MQDLLLVVIAVHIHQVKELLSVNYEIGTVFSEVLASCKSSPLVNSCNFFLFFDLLVHERAHEFCYVD